MTVKCKSSRGVIRVAFPDRTPDVYHDSLGILPQRAVHSSPVKAQLQYANRDNTAFHPAQRRLLRLLNCFFFN